ncbi:MAG: DNA alkylation repair protein [endosymbiont of Galathealinum brachiosum]|uniref:DNA alkylation repair protein n=1 Tax=endosymbiont of Galathealinum brachiosum TaxID=2200906 RepID=A0A370DMF4_9GAMM|nr:MAG: DNA alkylation repair protein [endosymbiont of Galathealinum brachiosum]
MAEPFKNIYNQRFFDGFTDVLRRVIPDFDSSAFLKEIYDDEWDNRELKQRMRHISTVLKNYLPDNYNQAVDKILELINHLKENQCTLALEYMFLPDFIEQYGLQNYKVSVNAFEKITQFTSCEFAVRPFIIEYPNKMMKQMLAWSKHENHDVRRFSTEGCRPRLPWAMALPLLKENPSSVLPVLENLKNDDSAYVRKSVANNLNDIAKDNPEVVISLIKKWQGKTENTDWVIKHGSRTLLKQGEPEVMKVFGFGSTKNIDIDEFEIISPVVKIGGVLEFTFQLSNNNNKDTKLRLEYGLYYQKANGTLSKKVYKISEKLYENNSITLINRKQSFKLITTRKFHEGLHQVSIIVNGNEFEKNNFELVK